MPDLAPAFNDLRAGPMIRKIVLLLWPVHWLSFFKPVWGIDPRRPRREPQLIRPYGWRDIIDHARHLWVWGNWPPCDWGFVNTLYGGEVIV